MKFLQSFRQCPNFYDNTYERLNPVTWGIWLTHIAHHHLAIPVIFLIVCHMYRTNMSIEHRLKDILNAHRRFIYRTRPYRTSKARKKGTLGDLNEGNY